MCRSADASRAGYYRSQANEPEAEDKEDLDLRDQIQRIALEWPCYGRRRITAELKRKHWKVNHKRVHRIMREDNLLCLRRRKFVVTTDSGHKLPIYPNLVPGMVLTGMDQLWVADITYIRLETEFVYLAVILDAFSRRVIGWALDRTLEAELAVAALRLALRRRTPTAELVHHSDRGVQYASKDYTELLKEHGILISMSRKGNPYDNAACESFMKTLKYEEVVCCERRISKDPAMLYRRWRKILRSRPAGAGSKPPQAAGVKSPGGERCGKRRKQFRQVWLKETNVSEPLTTCRNVSNRRRNRDLDFYPASKGWERPAYCPTGVRHEGGVTLGRASIRNTGTCRSDVKGEIQAVHHRKGLSTDAEHRGGDARSRDEGPVMGLDRRGIVIRFLSGGQPARG